MFIVSGVPVKEHCVQEQERLRQECLHLQARLLAVQTECQKEREVRILHLQIINILTNLCVCIQHVPVSVFLQEKLMLREQLWESGAELQQQADFCSSLGSATCCLLWSSSARENTVTHWLADVSHLDSTACISSVYRLPSVFHGACFHTRVSIYCLHLCFSTHMAMQGKLQPFLAVAAQTLESFVRSLDDEVKTQTEDHNSQEHQFVLGLAGTITSELNAFVDTCATCISQHILKYIKLKYEEHCYNNCLFDEKQIACSDWCCNVGQMYY